MGGPDSKPKQAVPRDEKGRVLPGQSLNPGGKSKELAGMRRLIAERGPDLVRELMTIATGEAEDAKAGDRIKAIEVCLSYWLGKPTQEVKLNVGDDTADLVRATIERLRANPAANQAMVTLAEVSATSLPAKGEN